MFLLLCSSATSHILDQTAPTLEARFEDCVRSSSDNSSLGGRRSRGEYVVDFFMGPCDWTECKVVEPICLKDLDGTTKMHCASASHLEGIL